MSKNIGEINGLIITSFVGKKHKKCIQLTIPAEGYVQYVQLNKEEVMELIATLDKWVEG